MCDRVTRERRGRACFEFDAELKLIIGAPGTACVCPVL